MFDDMKVAPSARAIYQAMLTYAEDDGVAWVTKAQLRRHTGYSLPTIDAAIYALRNLGAVGDPVSRRTDSGFRQHGFEVRRPDEPRIEHVIARREADSAAHEEWLQSVQVPPSSPAVDHD